MDEIPVARLRSNRSRQTSRVRATDDELNRCRCRHTKDDSPLFGEYEEQWEDHHEGWLVRQRSQAEPCEPVSIGSQRNVAKREPQ